jgi:hypothetical protein
MKLTELGYTASSKKINKINESRFGFAIDFDNLTMDRAVRLSQALGENLEKVRRGFGIHTAEKNPKYMEMLMVREGLGRWIAENRLLTESEMAKSEAILAAKDMVDSVQDFIEDVSKMQNEQMPALLDTIRDQIGSAEADSFKAKVGGVLGSILTQLQDAREQLDGAARALAGEQVAGDAMAMPSAGSEMPAAPAGGAESDLDVDVDAFSATDAAAGGDTDLGREKR